MEPGGGRTTQTEWGRRDNGYDLRSSSSCSRASRSMRLISLRASWQGGRQKRGRQATDTVATGSSISHQGMVYLLICYQVSPKIYLRRTMNEYVFGMFRL